MAYVAISQTLIEDVRRSIEFKMRAEHATIARPALASNYTLAGAEREAFMIDKWGPHVHLEPLLPPHWTPVAQTISLRCDYSFPDPDHEGSFMLGSVTTTCNFVPPLRLPPGSDTYNLRAVVSREHPAVAPHAAYDVEIRRVTRRWAKIRDDVITFLRSCKSLNEALKLWPDVRIYVPQSYLSRAEEKTAKAKAAESKALEVLKSIDTDAAISSAVMVRILEANNQQEAQQ